MRQRRQIAAYGRSVDDAGRVLLARGAASGPYPGRWGLPGAVVRHAEHPADTVVREFTARAGLDVTVAGVRAAVADVTVHRAGATGVSVHTDRLVFDVTVRGDRPRPRAGGDVNGLTWCTPEQAVGLPLLPFTADLLGLPATPPDVAPPGAPPAGRADPTDPPADRADTTGPPVGSADGTVPPAGSTDATYLGGGSAEATEPPVGSAGAAAPAGGSADRRQRFAAYGLVTAPDERLLLTRIAPGYPGAGKWHLPGGGTDHGEQPVDGLLRELVEESGQVGRADRLLLVDNLHNPAAIGPEGRPLDWHGVRVIYRVLVDEPGEPVVTEQPGGSTAAAAWFAFSQLSGLDLTDVAILATGSTVG
ncbi:NUDIX domain-containing protein [Micromonospora sp. WMMD987]|uniref:NUDIX hydrolase n=1 Tax=Micromonospora sp. WMMD987 TaxID=3016089 RepID=UPI00249C5743|nr:NUDIX domain-containing protein [Micromonospora sp. WMMD987]WFE94740.1 NUDIX domain-containing protein [Micromonospora sp. WMMD987]